MPWEPGVGSVVVGAVDSYSVAQPLLRVDVGLTSEMSTCASCWLLLVVGMLPIVVPLLSRSCCVFVLVVLVLLLALTLALTAIYARAHCGRRCNIGL
jgi:hypothetical protein